MTRFLALLAMLFAIPSLALAQSEGAVTPGNVAPRSNLVGCIYNSSQPTASNGQQQAVQCDANGNLKTSGGGGGAVTVADGADVTQGAKADGACGTDAGTCTVVSLVKRLNQNVAGAIPAGTNTIGGVVPTASASGVGATAYGLQTTASTNSTSVKGSAGTLYGLNLVNTTTTIYYLRMYDAASAPTCSSATNFSRTWPVPPASVSGGAGGIAPSIPAVGVTFTNGIAFCVTGGPSSTDNTNAATGVFVNIDYK